MTGVNAALLVDRGHRALMESGVLPYASQVQAKLAANARLRYNG